MKIKSHDYNEVTVIELQGELDADAVEEFQKVLTETVARYRQGIVLDMSKVSFCDSHGLEKLLWSRDFCSEHNCEFKMAQLDSTCRKILEITRLINKFDEYQELSDAVKSSA